MKRSFFILFALVYACAAPVFADDPFPIDRTWSSLAFRKALTASYGVDARIEPTVDPEEQGELQLVASDLASGRRTDAIRLLRNNLRLDNSAVLQFTLAGLLFEEGETAAAMRGFEKALELHPNFRDAHRNLAVAHLRAEQTDQAFPHLVRAVELGARDGITLGFLGYCHSQADRPQPALQAYRMAQLTQPDELQWQQGEAHSLAALGENRASAAIFRRLLDAEPDRTAFWLAEARALLDLDPERALANLEFLRRRKALDADNLHVLGSMYLNQSVPEEAAACFRAALSAAPPLAAEKVASAAEALLAVGLPDEANTLAASLPATDANAIRLRALCELASENATPVRPAVVASVESLLERNPLDGQALLLLGQFREAEGKPQAAALLFEQAARDPEHAAEALRHHGMLQVRLREIPAALNLLQRSHNLSPDPGLAKLIDAVRAL